MDPHEKFNKLLQYMDESHPPGEEVEFRFYPGDGMSAGQTIYSYQIMAIPIGLITVDDLPNAGAGIKAVTFKSGVFATTNRRLAAALTFQTNIIPSPMWYKEMNEAVDPVVVEVVIEDEPETQEVVEDEGDKPKRGRPKKVSDDDSV